MKQCFNNIINRRCKIVSMTKYVNIKNKFKTALLITTEMNFVNTGRSSTAEENNLYAFFVDTSIYYYSINSMITNNIFNINLIEFSLIPEFFLGFSSMVLSIYVSLVAYNQRYSFQIIQKTLLSLSFIFFILTFILLINDYLLTTSKQISLNSLSFCSFLSLFSKLILISFSCLCLCSIWCYIVKDSKLNNSEYLLLFIYAVLGLMLLISTNDLLSLFLTLELQGLSLYVISAFKKDSVYSISSGLNYFILGAFSSSLFLFGSSFIYGLTGLTNFFFFNLFFFNELVVGNIIEGKENIVFFISDSTILFNKNISFFFENYIQQVAENPNMYFSRFEKIVYNFLKIIKLTVPFFIVILLSGLLFKIAAAPFHLWALDVYEGSPTSSTVIFAVLTKISILVVLIKICYYCFYTFFVKDLSQYISFTGLLSIFVGSVVGLTERKIKSLLTFSSINNIGYLVLAISSSVKSSIQTTFMYLINYTNANLALWTIIVTIRFKRNRFIKKLNKDFSDVFLLIKKNKTLLCLSIITIFSLAGIPPFIGFLAKMGILLTLIETKASLNASITIILSATSAFYYLRILKIMQFEESRLILENLCVSVETLMSGLHITLNFFTLYQSLTPWISFLLAQKTVIC